MIPNYPPPEDGPENKNPNMALLSKEIHKFTTFSEFLEYIIDKINTRVNETNDQNEKALFFSLLDALYVMETLQNRLNHLKDRPSYDQDKKQVLSKLAKQYPTFELLANNLHKIL